MKVILFNQALKANLNRYVTLGVYNKKFCLTNEILTKIVDFFRLLRSIFFFQIGFRTSFFHPILMKVIPFNLALKANLNRYVILRVYNKKFCLTNEILTKIVDFFRILRAIFFVSNQFSHEFFSPNLNESYTIQSSVES